MRPKFQLSYLQPGPGEQVSIREDEVRLVLEKLPDEAWSRFQVIHFNDVRRGLRWIGYINRERGEIAISPLPPGTRRMRFLIRGTPDQRDGRRRLGRKRVVQRDLLFDVYLDEIGQLQVIDEKSHHVRAQSLQPPEPEHTDYWRLRLWSFKFDRLEEPKEFHPEESIAEVRDVTEERR